MIRCTIAASSAVLAVLQGREMKMEALQMCEFIPFLERELQRRFRVMRYAESVNDAQWLAANAKNVRIVVTGGNIGISNDLIGALPNLGMVAINGVGFDKVDIALARQRGIRVANTPDVLSDDVADLAIGLIISVLRGIAAGDQYVRTNRWLEGDKPLARKVTGRRFGILGLGRIGEAVAARLTPFGSVAYHSTHEKPVAYQYYRSVEDLARACDVLVITASANPSTRGLVGRVALDALGKDGYLINVSRGSLVNEPELIAALNEGRIAGAALDVFADEPKVPEALRSSPNVVLTPHIGTATWETRENMGRLLLANLDAFVAGEALPTAVV